MNEKFLEYIVQRLDRFLTPEFHVNRPEILWKDSCAKIVISCAIEYVLRDIIVYLDYYEENIVKGSGEPLSWEEMRIRKQVLVPYLRKLKQIPESMTDEDVLSATSILIEKWCEFGRINVQDILNQTED